MQLKKVLVFPHSASFDGFGQFMNKCFLMQNKINPFSIVSHGGAPGLGGIFSFMVTAEEKYLFNNHNWYLCF